jgi:glycosyltransferase involved in cell wall biosynthesis
MLVIFSTHPIQYQIPLWQALARDGRIPFEVWYLTDHGTRVSHDREFGKAFAWDLETLGGYPYRFLESSFDGKPVTFWKWRLTENLSARCKVMNVTAFWMQGWQVAGYWQAALMAKRAGVALWLRGESNDLKRVSSFRRLAKRVLLGRLFRWVDHFLYIGTANRRLYQQYGVPSSRLHYAPYAIDNERFAAQAAALRPSRADIRSRWGIPEDSFCVLFCGKFIPKKHPQDLIAAANLLRAKRIPKIHLLFVGSGQLGDDLKKACAVVFDADSESAVDEDPEGRGPLATFAGFLNQQEISKAYVAADCLALPSDEGETWGLVVNEAMASGLACVASRACGCTEDLILPYWPGRTFDAGDPAGLADAVHDVFAKSIPGDVESRISSHSIQATLDQIVQLYEQGQAGHASVRKSSV